MGDTANTEPMDHQLPDGAVGTEGQNTPDLEGGRDSELRAKNTELQTKIATLEKAIDEMRLAGNKSYPQQPQGIDDAQLRAAMEAITDGGDASLASQKLGSVLNAAGQNLTQDAVHQMRTYLQIERDLNEKAKTRSYLENFRPLVEQRIADYVSAGYDAKQATDAALRDYDQQFGAYEAKIKPKPEANPAPLGAQGMTGQTPMVKPPPPPPPDTPDRYVDSRINSRNSKLFGVSPR